MTVLMTGFPGFLGSALLPRILGGTDEIAVCLVQRKFAHLAQRRAEALATADPTLSGRIRIVTGDITKSEEFEKAYDLMFAEIGHDPRYKAAQGAIMDLVTPAIAELRSIIVNRGASPATKVKAIELALKVAKLELKPPEESDRTDIIKWTEEHRTEVQIPKEFLDAAQKYGLDRIVEGQFQAAAETDDSTPLLSSNVESSAASINAN
jgi:hypothetical protein